MSSGELEEKNQLKAKTPDSINVETLDTEETKNNNDTNIVKLSPMENGLKDDIKLGEVKTGTGNHSQSDLLKRVSTTLLNVDRSRIPVTIKWENLNYTVQISNPKGPKCCNTKISKTILNNVSGQAKSGELVAIMGPSGSGKTTLLNALAGRIVESKGSSLTGSIKINGIDKTELGSKYARLAAYVQQDDVLFNMQTVKETLLTAALFRLPKNMELAEKEERVNAVIQELGLNKCKDTHIGDTTHRGVSGGERKRTNIGVELIQDPSLLFLDEPTSGLDSFQALNVVETLKILATSGCTVVTSIHQPRSSIYQLFDRLILLSEGSVVYDGLAGEHAVEYFSKLDYKCPSFFNPADYFLDIVSFDNRSSISENESQERIKFLIKSHAQLTNNKTEIKNNNKSETSSDFVSGIMPVTSVRSSIIDQFIILFIRNFRQLSRNKISLFIRLFFSLFFSLFLSAIYSGTDKSQKSFQARSGVLFFVAVNQSFGSMMDVVNTFAIDKAIITRERQAKSYHLINYYSTKFLTALPVEIFYPLIFACVLYYATNLHPSLEAFGVFIILTMATALSAQAVGFIVGAMAPTIEAGNAMAPPFMVIMILFGGYYINDEKMPIWLGWLQNLSIIRWSFVGLMVNEFEGVKNFKCGDSNDSSQCFETGNEYLKRFSFDEFTKWECIIYLIAITFGYHLIAFIILKFNKPKYLEVTQQNNKVEKKYVNTQSIDTKPKGIELVQTNQNQNTEDTIR